MLVFIIFMKKSIHMKEQQEVKHYSFIQISSNAVWTLNIWKVEILKRMCFLVSFVYSNHKYDIPENNYKSGSWANVINLKSCWNTLQFYNSNDDTTLQKNVLHNVEHYKQFIDIITCVFFASML